jgi:hypothetical protein
MFKRPRSGSVRKAARRCQEQVRQDEARTRAEAGLKRRLSDVGSSSLPLAKSARVAGLAVESEEDDIEDGDERVRGAESDRGW